MSPSNRTLFRPLGSLRYTSHAPGVAVALRPKPMPVRSTRFSALFMALAMILSSTARADGDVVPPSIELPQVLGLDEALRIFRSRGLDLLIAEASVRSAEGAVKIAGAPSGGNPVVSASLGNAFTYVPNQAVCNQNGAVCTPWVVNLGLSDQAAIAVSLSG
jgi:hypothetical protein